MEIIEVQRIPNGIDSVKIDKKEYIIRFSAKHAQHIIENRENSAHNISFDEIVTLIKNSVFLPKVASKPLFLGRKGGKIYETYCYLTKDRIDVVTSFASNKPPYIQEFKKYENSK